MNLIEAMKKLNEKRIYEKDNKILNEMSNIRKDKTGLPVNIWLDDIGSRRKTKHNKKRIKVQNDTQLKFSGDTFSLLIDKNSPRILAGKSKLSVKDYKLVIEWVKLNYDLLVKFWDGEIDTVDFINNMEKLK